MPVCQRCGEDNPERARFCLGCAAPLAAPPVVRREERKRAEWAYQRPYRSNQERSAALDGWLHLYNHHRARTALDGHPPISRVNNAPTPTASA